MLVTLPFVLLLLDYWPLRRIEEGRNSESGIWRTGGPRQRPFLHSFLLLLVEKRPFFALSPLMRRDVLGPEGGGAVRPMGGADFPQRLANAVVAYAVYLENMFGRRT